MKYRKFGNTELVSSEISLGCNNLGGNIFGSSQKSNDSDLLHKAIDLGINLFDTAPHYSYGDSETILGQSLIGKRKDIYLVTKCGRLLSSLAKKGKAIRHFKSVAAPLLSPFRSTLKSISKSNCVRIYINFFQKRLLRYNCLWMTYLV